MNSKISWRVPREIINVTKIPALLEDYKLSELLRIASITIPKLKIGRYKDLTNGFNLNGDAFKDV
jgi:hypothetical protein